MKIKVLYFASIKDKLGEESEDFEVEEGISLGSLINRVKAKNSSIASFLESRSFLYAINQETADLNATLKPDDEVAILPPLSGG